MSRWDWLGVVLAMAIGAFLSIGGIRFYEWEFYAVFGCIIASGRVSRRAERAS